MKATMSAPVLAPAMAPMLALSLLLVGLSGCLKDDFFLPETRDRTGVEALAGDVTLREVASGFSKPLFFLEPEAGTFLVVEQTGKVRTVDGGVWLDVSDRVGDCHFEQGLLGLAVAPGFPADERFWIVYTDTPCQGERKGELVLEEGTAQAGRAIRSSLQERLRIEEPYGNHNGGHLAFGPDGMLYMSVGDGGSHGDPHGNGQDPYTRLGTILRLDVDRDDLTPADNPWRFSFDREAGDLWIGDVGQNDIEEVNLEPAGSPGGHNYGWNRFEGKAIYERDTAAPGAVPPVHQYSHAGGSCSVTGGYVYRGAAIPELQGTYLFGDYCSGNIWGLQQRDGEWRASILFGTEFNISSFGQDAAGELYVVAHAGRVLQIVAA